jgi:hypothetical protein
VSRGQPDPEARRPLRGRRVFLSASIPGKGWDDVEFDPLEITDAVIACASTMWTAGGRILCGGHPAITPLLLRAAQDFRQVAESIQATDNEPLVTIYQSELFQGLIPDETKRLQAGGLGRIAFVRAVPGDRPDRHHNAASLAHMRQAMLAPQNDPAFAIFIGGMDGIITEYQQYRRLYNDRPVYAIGAPGAMARRLAAELMNTEYYRPGNGEALLNSAEYTTLMNDIVADAIDRIGY